MRSYCGPFRNFYEVVPHGGELVSIPKHYKINDGNFYKLYRLVTCYPGREYHIAKLISTDFLVLNYPSRFRTCKKQMNFVLKTNEFRVKWFDFQKFLNSKIFSGSLQAATILWSFILRCCHYSSVLEEQTRLGLRDRKHELTWNFQIRREEGSAKIQLEAHEDIFHVYCELWKYWRR